MNEAFNFATPTALVYDTLIYTQEQLAQHILEREV